MQTYFNSPTHDYDNSFLSTKPFEDTFTPLHPPSSPCHSDISNECENPPGTPSLSIVDNDNDEYDPPAEITKVFKQQQATETTTTTTTTTQCKDDDYDDIDDEDNDSSFQEDMDLDHLNDMIMHAKQHEWLFWFDMVFPRHNGSTLLLGRQEALRIVENIEIVSQRYSDFENNPRGSQLPCVIWKKKDSQFYVSSIKRRLRPRRMIYEYCFGADVAKDKFCSTFLKNAYKGSKVKQCCPMDRNCIQPFHLYIPER